MDLIEKKYSFFKSPLGSKLKLTISMLPKLLTSNLISNLQTSINYNLSPIGYNFGAKGQFQVNEKYLEQ